MNRSMNSISASPNRIPFGNAENRKVVASPPRWNCHQDQIDYKVSQHEKENRKNTPFKAKWTPAPQRDCSPTISSPSPRSMDDSSCDTDDDDEDSVVSLSDMDFVHARLDASVSCCLCNASHALYLMYPIIKTLDNWNESSKYLCSICYADEDNRQDDPESPSQPSDILFPKPRVLATRPMSRKTTTSLISKATCKVQECLDVLHCVEEELEVAAKSLSQDGRLVLEASIRRELANDNDQAEAKVQEELATSNSLWQLHWDLLSETAMVLQAALDQEGDDECDLLLAYYQWRAGSSFQDSASPTWKGTADQALTQRDLAAGVGPGHFWGATRRADPQKPIKIVESKSPQDIDSDTSRRDKNKSNPDLIEELATLPESQVYQLLLPVRRGLGWRTCQPHDQSEEAEAYEAEASVPCIPRTEYQDRNLMKKEHYHEVRTILVMVEEEDVLVPELPSTENVNTIHSRPGLMDSREPSTQPSCSPTPKESLKRELDNPPESGTLSWAPAKRAKRRCLRCVKFEGRSPTRCRGSKGRWGQKGCEYFTINGKPMK